MTRKWTSCNRVRVAPRSAWRAARSCIARRNRMTYQGRFLLWRTALSTPSQMPCLSGLLSTASRATACTEFPCASMSNILPDIPHFHNCALRTTALTPHARYLFANSPGSSTETSRRLCCARFQNLADTGEKNKQFRLSLVLKSTFIDLRGERRFKK